MGDTVMAGTIAGGNKSYLRIVAKDPDFYKRIGRLGGMAKHPNKGFGADKKRAIEAGRKGGHISKRRKKV